MKIVEITKIYVKRILYVNGVIPVNIMKNRRKKTPTLNIVLRKKVNERKC